MAILHIIHEEGTQNYREFGGYVLITGAFANPNEDIVFCSGDLIDDWRRANEFLNDSNHPQGLIGLSSDVDDFLMSGERYRYDESTGLIYENTAP